MGLDALGRIGGIASTGLSIYGQAQQSKAAQAAAQYNAVLAEREAKNLELQTTESIRRQRINNSGGLASLRNRLGASGVRVDSGVAADTLGEAAARMELSIADAARSASIEATSLRQKGAMGIWEAKQQKKASTLSMIGTGIAGLGNAASQYQQGSYTGIFPRIGS